MLQFIQRKLMYPRRRVDYSENRPDLPENGEWLQVGSEGVDTIYLKSCQDSNEPRPAVVFAHGNAESIDDWIESLQTYTEFGFDVVLPEYRGYGRSPGKPSKKAIMEDFLAVINSITGREQVDPNRLIFHGRSIGGGVVCELARHYYPRALILQSTFSSVSNLVSEDFGLPGWLLSEGYDNEEFIKGYSNRVLVIHGDADELIPYRHAKKLNDAASQGRLVTLKGRGHNDTPVPWTEIRAFMHGLTPNE